MSQFQINIPINKKYVIQNTNTEIMKLITQKQHVDTLDVQIHASSSLN